MFPLRAARKEVPRTRFRRSVYKLRMLANLIRRPGCFGEHPLVAVLDENAQLDGFGATHAGEEVLRTSVKVYRQTSPPLTRLMNVGKPIFGSTVLLKDCVVIQAPSPQCGRHPLQCELGSRKETSRSPLVDQRVMADGTRGCHGLELGDFSISPALRRYLVPNFDNHRGCLLAAKFCNLRLVKQSYSYPHTQYRVGARSTTIHETALVLIL